MIGDDFADVLLCHGFPLTPGAVYSRAAAPETISISSFVMRAWRARL